MIRLPANAVAVRETVACLLEHGPMTRNAFAERMQLGDKIAKLRLHHGLVRGLVEHCGSVPRVHGRGPREVLLYRATADAAQYMAEDAARQEGRATAGIVAEALRTQPRSVFEWAGVGV